MTPRHFAWQARHLVTLPSFHVAGVALGDIHLHFAWQAWFSWGWACSGDALGRAVTPRDAAPFCVAGRGAW